MNTISKCLAGAMLLLTFSCERHDALMYENDPRISFARGDDGYGQQDSILHSFFTVSEKQNRDTVWVELAIMGLPADQERPVKIVQTNTEATDAALPGTHYIAFDNPEVTGRMVIKSGQVTAKVPVILLRDASLQVSKKRLELEIMPNDYFQRGIDADCHFMIQTTALAERPDSWAEEWERYFGSWSSQKMWFIVNYLGLNDFNEEYDTAYKYYLKQKAHTKLQEYNSTHDEPLCNDPYKHHEPGETCDKCVIFP